MFEVLGFYKFVKIKSLKKNKVLLQDFLINKKIRGTIIIASEGINGTISGKAKDIKSTINRLKKMFSFKEFDNSNNSKSSFQPFHKPKVKVKKEVVPMNLTLNSKDRNLDTHLDPKEWNDLIKKKAPILLIQENLSNLMLGHSKSQLILMLIILEIFQNI
jgi:UPF0176 protein